LLKDSMGAVNGYYTFTEDTNGQDHIWLTIPIKQLRLIGVIDYFILEAGHPGFRLSEPTSVSVLLYICCCYCCFL